jgi:hypothetical protein
MSSALHDDVVPGYGIDSRVGTAEIEGRRHGGVTRKMAGDFKDLERQIRRILRRREMEASIVLHRLGHTACSLAISGAEEYLRAARLQMRRIDAAVSSRSPDRDGTRVFREIHFYMICWDAIWKRRITCLVGTSSNTTSTGLEDAHR